MTKLPFMAIHIEAQVFVIVSMPATEITNSNLTNFNKINNFIFEILSLKELQLFKGFAIFGNLGNTFIHSRIKNNSKKYYDMNFDEKCEFCNLCQKLVLAILQNSHLFHFVSFTEQFCMKFHNACFDFHTEIFLFKFVEHSYCGEKGWKKASSYLYGEKAEIKRLDHNKSCMIFYKLKSATFEFLMESLNNVYLLLLFKKLSLLSYYCSSREPEQYFGRNYLTSYVSNLSQIRCFSSLHYFEENNISLKD
ncbi:hypothetical protein BpHYR1_022216 [Brachionus plicatilis]|uniref:Uncharacterized protein n=1 Tax=Brachionus plicatilis TaxID=10195 RepID=A0A3M7Q7R2_BRAPC|nr:hypothetical protein BpHYR1_022216 [Brachionus plicatilis]